MKSTPKILLAAALAGLLFGASQATALTTTANLSVSATIGSSCVISNSGSPAAPFTYDPVGANATTPATPSTTISYSCTSGTTPISFVLDQGAHANTGSTAAAPDRRMLNGTANFLSYNIFSSAANQTTGTALVAWGTANGPTLVAGTGATQTLSLFFRIPAGQSALPAGTYSDTVLETLTF